MAAKTFPRYSLRSRLLLLSGATFLVCAGTILMFFPLLNLTLEGALEGSTTLMEEAKGVEADTIARLMVLEFSLMQELLQTRAGDIDEVDQRIMNLIWQKVTFNEVIRGLELIRSPADAEGQRLTYFFYRREGRLLEPMSGPQKMLKKFSGPERELLDNINAPPTLKRDKMETSVLLGPKAEGQMLLRYLPLHVLVPDEGAIFWGVAKIGVDVSGLAELKTMQDRERSRLRHAVWGALVLSLIVAGILAVSLLYLWARSLTEPLRLLSEAARDFRALKPEEFDPWLDNLRGLDHRGQAEIIDLKNTLLRLGRSLPNLGERLFAEEPQACLTRVAARALPALLADSATWQQYRDLMLRRCLALERTKAAIAAGQEASGAQASLEEGFAAVDTAWSRLESGLRDWHYFTEEPSREWQRCDLTPILHRAWRLAALGQPASDGWGCEIRDLPPVFGSPGYLARAVLMLLDFGAAVLPQQGRLALKADSGPERGLTITVALSGPAFTSEQCKAMLQPTPGEQDLDGTLGPAVAAAIARWHGGELTARPGTPQGLTFTLSLPPAPET